MTNAIARVSHPPRAVIDERTTYLRSRSAMEEYIVPLLNAEVTHAVHTYFSRGLEPERVLDAGCGGQPFRTLIEGLGFDYVGLDVQQNPAGSVDLLVAIDGELPREVELHEQFSHVLCTEVLEHVADWPAAFCNIRRLLKPGGTVIITCPHFYPLHEQPYDFWRPTNHALVWQAHRAGFEVLTGRTVGDAWDVLGTVLGACDALPRRESIIGHAAALIIRKGFAAIRRLLQTRFLQRRFKLSRPDYPLYLSNIMVLQKPLRPVEDLA